MRPPRRPNSRILLDGFHLNSHDHILIPPGSIGEAIHGAGPEVQIASDHVGMSGVRDPQLHVDAQLLGSSTIVDQLLVAEGRVLTIDPDLVARTG